MSSVNLRTRVTMFCDSILRGIKLVKDCSDKKSCMDNRNKVTDVEI